MLPPKGLLTCRFDAERFPSTPGTCYRAPWHLPGPDFHRLANSSFASMFMLLASPPSIYLEHRCSWTRNVVGSPGATRQSTAFDPLVLEIHCFDHELSSRHDVHRLDQVIDWSALGFTCVHGLRTPAILVFSNCTLAGRYRTGMQVERVGRRIYSLRPVHFLARAPRPTTRPTVDPSRSERIARLRCQGRPIRRNAR